MAKDALTGLYDFLEFSDICKNHLANNPGNYVIVVNDVSNFKYINKFYSKETGDFFIKEMALYFHVNNPRSVCACRLDSEQFCTLLEIGDTSHNDELDRIATMNKVFENKMSGQFPDIFIHVYTGIYFFGNYNEDFRSAFDKAKRSKASIKGRFDIPYQVYDPERFLDNEIVMEASSTFRRALQDDRVTVFLQPKFSVSENKAIGAEALARIISETGDIIPPARFIPALEQTGIIGVLDMLMVEKVFKLQKKWMEEGRTLFPISINISRQEYIKDTFADQMIELQKKYAVPSYCIEFEILESMFVDNDSLIISTTNALRAYGFRVSVDDFGSGYSNLNQIANMPADTIKMDNSFVRTSLTTEKGCVVIKSLIQLLHEIDYNIVFEGIETEEQKDAIVSMGCDVIQGFYYSKPIPVSEFEKKFL